jgi:hypothetical protein
LTTDASALCEALSGRPVHLGQHRFRVGDRLDERRTEVVIAEDDVHPDLLGMQDSQVA